ncbi:MAG TPA: glycerophosphodiester phosphodiesterase family protein, partial [Gemmatimonadaceae bacterium]|nr:glycerophosphodiester phosphodiesterase family protein [Gemmatimonadaceae bacterium]
FAAASLRAARAAGLPTIASRPELIRLLPRAVFGIRNRRPRVFRAIAMPPTYGGWTLPLRGIVRASGVPVHVWTVNDRAEATHYWEAGVNGILTDDPVTMISLRASRFSSPMLPS